MTVETRTFIGPKDVLALEIECSKCHQKTIRKLDSWLQEINSCANCGTSWMTARDQLKILADTAAHIRAVANLEAATMPFTVRFEVTGEKKP